MDIGFTGNIIIVLKKPIDDEEPMRIYADLLSANDAGINVSFEDTEEETRTCFIPFSNIRCIEKAESPEPETPESPESISGGASAPEAATPPGGSPTESQQASPTGGY